MTRCRRDAPPEGVDLAHPPRNAEEKYVSRYIDEQNAPLLSLRLRPFVRAFQLFVAKAQRHRHQCPRAELRKRQPFAVSAVVTNSGTRAGRETVELYIRQRGTSVSRPIKELKGFQVVELQPGESRTVEFTLGRDQLAFWDLDMRYQVEPAEVSVWIAPNSADGAPSQFTITE